jgi:hypothetical protein
VNVSPREEVSLFCPTLLKNERLLLTSRCIAVSCGGSFAMCSRRIANDFARIRRYCGACLASYLRAMLRFLRDLRMSPAAVRKGMLQRLPTL